MWIVRNTLRGTLTFRGLGVSIPPEEELDLDAHLGRERAERSNQVAVAFEEGYLETVNKDRDGALASVAPVHHGITSAELESALEDRMASFKASLAEELQTLRSALSGDVRGMLENLKVAKLKLNEEKQRILVDRNLSQVEIRARLAFLEEQERELTKNFQQIGRKMESSGDVEAKADLLSSI